MDSTQLKAARSRAHATMGQIPHSGQVILVWLAATCFTLVLARLGAHDTPATPWAGAHPTWSEHVLFWDSGWYGRIWQDGYPSSLPLTETGSVAQNAWAFMPLLPMLAGALSLLGLPFAWAATAVSVACSAASAVVLDRLLAPRVGAGASLWAVALAWSGPCALIFQVPYAESLAMLLLVCILWAVSERRFVAAAPLIALLCLARPIGAPVAIMLGLWCLREAWMLRRGRHAIFDAAGMPHSYGHGNPTLTWGQWRGLVALTLWAGLCTFIWPAIAWAATGRADAYTATEAAWRGKEIQPVVAWFDAGGAWVGQHLSGVFVLAVIGLACLGLSSRYLRGLGPVPWLWCVAYCLYLLLVFYPTTSTIRLLMPLVPACWAIMTAASDTAQPGRIRAGLLLGALVGQVLWIAWVWDFGSVTMSWVP